jgi:uncharacterized iron-regulated membrane protein
MRTSTLRRWQWTHKWSSIVCTAFLLIICVTGLPLIFNEEIDHWLDPSPAYAVVPAGTPNISLDRLAARARGMFPGEVITSIFSDDDEPQIYVWMAPSYAAVSANPRLGHFVRFDAHSGSVIEGAKAAEQQRPGFMDIMLRLHMDLFVGLAGELFMGLMGLLFVIAIVSGIALYGPFTRKLEFGAVRTDRSRRTRWLDLHNLLGVVTFAWVLVVGATGVMNELSKPLFGIWQMTDVRALLAPWQGKPPPGLGELSSPQAALEAAQRAVPAMNVTSIVFPGAPNSSPHHYLLWASGKTPLTSRLFSPILVDARTGKLSAVVRMPWYLRALEISRPLHFGDYGGMPLKILWAMLDLVTIAVLGSGLYLWLGKSRRAIEPARGSAHFVHAQAAE